MKKYKDLYEEEKKRHEEVLKRYQEDYTDEMKIINLHKRCSKTKAVAKTAPKAPKNRYHLFLREQLDEMTGENRKNYRSVVSRRWKEIKEDPERLSEYNNMARQMQIEAEEPGDDSQNEKTMVDRHTAKHFKKVPKTPEFVNADSDDMDDEQGRQPKKAPKTPKFVDTDSDDTDDEQGLTAKHPQKASKASEFVDKGTNDEQEPAVKCIVMYSTEDEQEPSFGTDSDNEKEPAVKCIVMYSTEDEQEPVVKKLQKTSQIPMLAAASCTHILTSGVRKGNQCRFRASDETSKFYHHHKQT